MMNASQRFWNRLAPGFDAQAAKREGSMENNLAWAMKFLHNRDTVLDFGCATGSISLKIASSVREVHAIDFSESMIRSALQKQAESGTANVRFTQAEIFNPGLENETYDAVLAFGILHLLRDPLKAIRRIHDLLKPGGVFVSSSACRKEGFSIPGLVNGVAAVLGGAGIAPVVRFPRVSELEEIVRLARFRILEKDGHAFDGTPVNDVQLFVLNIAAIKEETDQVSGRYQ